MDKSTGRRVGVCGITMRWITTILISVVLYMIVGVISFPFFGVFFLSIFWAMVLGGVGGSALYFFSWLATMIILPMLLDVVCYAHTGGRVVDLLCNHQVREREERCSLLSIMCGVHPTWPT